MRARAAIGATALLLGGCHAYQRDPRYALARLVEVVRDPLHPDNLKYSAVLLIVALALVAAGVIAVRAASRSSSSREPRG